MYVIVPLPNKTFLEYIFSVVKENFKTEDLVSFLHSMSFYI